MNAYSIKTLAQNAVIFIFKLTHSQHTAYIGEMTVEAIEEVFLDEVSVDLMNVDKMIVDKMIVDKIMVFKINVDILNDFRYLT
jgi:hypothetical protein